MASRHTRFLELISGHHRELPYRLARGGLWLLSIPYQFIIAARNAYYDRFQNSQKRVNRLVISIGNITVGGTGKTPLAARIARMLNDRGQKVALLTRGYKGRPIQFDADRRAEAVGQWRKESDEAQVLQRHCPFASVIVNPDRLSGAVHAIGTGAGVIVLDDGFQHRRLARDLDIVLVDATSPFGHGHMLPRGLLREPVRSLRRADIIVLTRSDEIGEATRRPLVGQLKRVSGSKPVVCAEHRIRGFADVKDRPIEVAEPDAMRAVIFAGIANFESFRHGVASLGVEILAAYEYPDHHDYTTEELSGLRAAAECLEANAILTTEKDAVKLVGRWEDESCRLLVVQLEIEFDEAGETIVPEALDDLLSRRSQPNGHG